MVEQQSFYLGAMIIFFLGAIALITFMALAIKLLGRKAVLWIFGIVGGLAVLLLVWTAKPMFHPPAPERQTSVTASRVESDGWEYSRSVTVMDEVKTSEGGQRITPDMEWRPSADFEFEADIYPSAVSAGLFAAKHLWSQMADKEEIPSRPSLNLYVDKNGGKYATALALALERNLPISKADVFGPDDPPPGAPDQPILQLSIPVPVSDPASEANFMQVDLSYRDTAIRHRARFIEKPWVEESYDFMSYSAHHDPSGRMVHSQGLFATREEAERQALNHAVDGIINEAQKLRLVTRTNDKAREQFQAAVKSILQRGRLEPGGPYEKDHVREEDPLHYGRTVIKDRFTQSFNRPYGRVYRQALLLDVPAQTMVLEIVSEANASLRQARRTKVLTHVASIAGMILLITVVYLFLNAATRGYYLWSLRVAGGVIVIAGLWLVLNYA